MGQGAALDADHPGHAGGFAPARGLPAWLSAAVVLGLEGLALWAIRDNLTLNALMPAWPLDAARQWQAGG